MATRAQYCADVSRPLPAQHHSRLPNLPYPAGYAWSLSIVGGVARRYCASCGCDPQMPVLQFS